MMTKALRSCLLVFVLASVSQKPCLWAASPKHDVDQESVDTLTDPASFPTEPVVVGDPSNQFNQQSEIPEHQSDFSSNDEDDYEDEYDQENNNNNSNIEQEEIKPSKRERNRGRKSSNDNNKGLVSLKDKEEVDSLEDRPEPSSSGVRQRIQWCMDRQRDALVDGLEKIFQMEANKRRAEENLQVRSRVQNEKQKVEKKYKKKFKDIEEQCKQDFRDHCLNILENVMKTLKNFEAGKGDDSQLQNLFAELVDLEKLATLTTKSNKEVLREIQKDPEYQLLVLEAQNKAMKIMKQREWNEKPRLKKVIHYVRPSTYVNLFYDNFEVFLDAATYAFGAAVTAYKLGLIV